MVSFIHVNNNLYNLNVLIQFNLYNLHVYIYIYIYIYIYNVSLPWSTAVGGVLDLVGAFTR